MSLLEFEGTFNSLKSLRTLRKGLPPHFDLVVSGPTKGNQLSGSKLAIPVVAVTGRSGIQAGRWASRFCNLERLMGKRNGRLFTMSLVNGRLAEFDEMFYGILEDIQALDSDLISEDVLVREIYGILRSLRRGVTSHVLNIGMDERLFKAINRWRLEMTCLLYTSPSPRDQRGSRMPSSA